MHLMCAIDTCDGHHVSDARASASDNVEQALNGLHVMAGCNSGAGAGRAIDVHSIRDRFALADFEPPAGRCAYGRRQPRTPPLP